jgi:hypothetical protein
MLIVDVLFFCKELQADQALTVVAIIISDQIQSEHYLLRAQRLRATDQSEAFPVTLRAHSLGLKINKAQR